MKTRTAVIVAEGLVAGLIGFVVIALVMTIADLASGRTILFTPALLGSVLLEGARDACAVSVRATPLLAYSGIHLIVLVIFGLVGSYLIANSEQRPMYWFGALLFFVFVAWHLSGAVLSLMGPITGCVSLWWFLSASGAGALAMALYLWRSHPRLRKRLETDQYA